jgi:glyoxylase-like metal-dependent hydrolase (beta-lactamase superfamily II)
VISEPLEGIVRVTLPLPFGLDHVHCYLLRGADGWTLVDTGLGGPGAAERWASVLAGLDGPVVRVVVTHFHPDHVGAAAPAAEVTGAPVYEGVLDRAQCMRAWGPDRSAERFLAFNRLHGLPDDEVESLAQDSAGLASLVQPGPEPEPLAEGDRLDGWEVVHLPGHADGHLCLLRDGVLIAGDAILASISPNIGLYADSSPDPLADFLASLERIERLAPRVALTGHRETIDDPPARARELIRHHADRLAETLAALGREPRTGFDVSLDLFPNAPAGTPLRRFALAETCAHLEYLALRGRAQRLEEDGLIRYAAA